METLLDPNQQLSLTDLVVYYYKVQPKLKYHEIVSIINQHHGKHLTLRNLKNICAKQSLSRKCNVTHEQLCEAIRNEIGTSLSLVGYRQMYENLTLKYNINTSKEKVRLALLTVDPEGVEQRRSRTIQRRSYYTDGPGHIFHIDGNDKLKQWGFAIHGGIDGFSRKILWLSVSTTNNEPIAVANLFLNCVKRFLVAPKILRMDNGTENVHCNRLQEFFTGEDNRCINSVSVRNQRIESFWSRLKRYRTNWWIQLFRTMESEGLFNGELESHKELLLFCFMPVIQRELNDMLSTWNRRSVRQSNVSPGGKPDILFHVPATVGYSFQGTPVELEDINVASDLIGIIQQPFFKSKELYDLLMSYSVLHGLSQFNNAEDSLENYVRLLNLLQNDGVYF
uniref:Integrase core domain-containing protein n=1 Tax=Clytia hemisphaerica TaxID=252671 RepID=A0A7M5UQS5_9CNID|eukprot:TCONS_00000910-protein